MDEWREALKAIESGSFKTETVVVESNKSKVKSKKSRFNDKPKQRQENHGNSSNNANRVFDGMSQTDFYKSLQKPSPAELDQNMDMGMKDEINDDFMNYKRMQEQYRNNPKLSDSMPSYSRGGYEDSGTSNIGSSRMEMEYGESGVGIVRRNRAGLLGNDPMDNNVSRATRQDSSQRSVNEEMNRNRNKNGQERYSPSKAFENEDRNYGAGGDNQLIAQLKGLLGGDLMNASPEMMNLIKQKQDELNRMQNEYNSVIQRGNYQNERYQDRDRDNFSQSNNASDRDRGNTSWPDMYSENENTQQAMSNAMFNNPSALLAMDNFGGGRGAMGGMGMNMMDNQMGDARGRRTLLADPHMDQGQANINEGFNNYPGSHRKGDGIWDNNDQQNFGRSQDRLSNMPMPDLKDELKGDINYRFKHSLKSLGPRKEETILKFDWKCFQPSDYGLISSKHLRCFDCGTKVHDSESFVRHITGIKHRGEMSEVERESNKILREYRAELKEYERALAKDKGDLVSCALCECQVVGPISTHRAQLRHKHLKAYVHPFCKICGQEFDGRPEYEVHKFHPDHLMNNARENITKAFKPKGDEDFRDTLKELKEANSKGRTKERELRQQEKEKERKKRESERKSEKRDRREESEKKSEDDGIEVVKVVNSTPKKVEEEPKKSLIDSLELGSLESYDENKGVGREFLRPVTGFFCRICKKLLPTEEESISHMKSKIHWEACVKADKAKAIKRPATTATAQEPAAKKAATNSETDNAPA